MELIFDDFTAADYQEWKSSVFQGDAMYGCSGSEQKWSKATPQSKRDACLRALRELEKLATVVGDDAVILFGQAWDTILQTGRLSGRIDLVWFLSQ